MTTQTFQYSYLVHAPAENIYTHLADPKSYIGLSPLVGKVSDIEWLIDDQQQRIVTYKTVEMFQFLGFINYPNPLNVVMTLAQPNQQIISDVQSGMNVSVRFVFDLNQQAGGTTVTETITASTPALLSRFAINQAKAVQQHRIKTLKQRMENPNQKSE
ncbi:MAG: SRPBCC family protein [Anaerolineaceae bacterium]|nr:SRPBCC family protein [Anaerolineaceae bacterium]